MYIRVPRGNIFRYFVRANARVIGDGRNFTREKKYGVKKVCPTLVLGDIFRIG